MKSHKNWSLKDKNILKLNIDEYIFNIYIYIYIYIYMYVYIGEYNI